MSSRYDILEPLGEGGGGAVFKAWDRRLERYVAIKRLLPPDQRDGPGMGTDLRKEAGALSSLQHPNIVSVYDLDDLNGEPIVVMEFLNGETLEQTLRRGALTLGDFASVARQSLEGLVAAHRLGVQHRDIKPSNIMVNWLPNGDFLVKVLDFGLAAFSARPQVPTEGADGEIFGSVYCMSPEQFLREPPDARSDIYSLGCVFYYALTATYPFEGKSMEEIAAAHFNQVPTPILRLRGDVPPALSQWIAWLMHRQPEHRPKSAEEALDTFLKIQAGAIKSLTIAPTIPKAATTSVPVQKEIPAAKTNVTRPTAPRVPTVTKPAQKPPLLVIADRPAPQISAPVAPRAPLPGTLTAQPAGPKVGGGPTSRNQSKLILIGIATAVVTLGIALVAANFMKSTTPPPAFQPSVPPVANPVLWLRSDTGLKTKRGETLAQMGDRVDLWEDQAPAAGSNSAHYINTGATEAERLRRLPVLREISLINKTFQVLHFDGTAFLLLATDANLQAAIPNSVLEHNQPRMTYGLIVRIVTEPGKRVLLGPVGNAPLWQLFSEGGKLNIGSLADGGAVSSVDLPASDQFLGILLTLDNPARQAQIHLLDSGGTVSASPPMTNVASAAALHRLRLGAEGAVNDATIFHGDVAEIFLYSQIFTAVERDLFRAYFLKKYGKPST